MTVGRRWRGRTIGLGVVAVVAGLLAGVKVQSSGAERVDRIFVAATIDQDGGARIQEVIDYDFGPFGRRGIFRDVPDLQNGSPISVDSLTAPDTFIVEDPQAPSRCAVSITSFGERQAGRICIGEPDITIDGRHRYTINYELDTLVVDNNIGLDWMAIGDTWTVDIDEAEIHLLAPNELELSSCVVLGSFGSVCDIEPIAPGHIRVIVSGLRGLDSEWDMPSEAVRIKATFGQPVPPPGPAPLASAMNPDNDRGFLFGAGAGLLATVIPSGLIAARASRAGREQAWDGSAIDTRYGPAVHADHEPTPAQSMPPPPATVRLRSEAELRKMAAVEYLPPEGLEPWQGGVLVDSDVRTNHQTAWLLQHAADGHIAFEGSDPTYLVRGPNTFDDSALETMLGGRNEVQLGEYDAQFAAGWEEASSQQAESLGDPYLWVEAGESSRNKAGCFGILAAAIGFLIVLILGSGGSIGFPILIIGCVLIGGGAASITTSSDLRVRTPAGSALFVHLEGFRRFIQTATVREVEWAAENRLLSQYSAWAVALGEAKNWCDLAAQSATAARLDPYGAGLAGTAGGLGAMAASSATSPSSSSSGGGGGGGGGGSW